MRPILWIAVVLMVLSTSPSVDPMEIKPKQPTVKGPADWFTGDVWIDSVVQPSDDSPLTVAAVHFAPGARTAWHSHAGGQNLYAPAGPGLVQPRAEPVVEVRCGKAALSMAARARDAPQWRVVGVQLERRGDRARRRR